MTQQSHYWAHTLRKTRIQKDTGISAFTAALSTIARTWKQPRCPMTEEWIKMLWGIYTMKYYSTIKKNTFESVLMRWMKLYTVKSVRKKNTNTVY